MNSPPAEEPTTEEGTRLGTAIASLATGNVIYAIGQWVMIVAIARIGDEETVGVFALGLALTAPVFAVAGMNLRIVVATDVDGSDHASDYLAVRLATTIVALFVVAGLLGVLRLGWTVTFVVFSIAISKAFEAVSDLAYGYLQGRGAMGTVGLSLVLRSVIGVPAFVVVFWATQNLTPAVLALAASWLGVAIFHDLAKSRRRLVTSADGPPARRTIRRATSVGIVRRSFPLGLAAGSHAATVNIPRYAVAVALGNASLGKFAAILYMVRAADTLGMGLRHAAAPRLARLHRDGEAEKFRRLVTKSGYGVLGGGTLGLVVVLLWGETLVRLLYGAAYVDQGLLVATVFAGTATIGFEFFEYALLAIGAFRASLAVRVVVMALVGIAAAAGISVLGLPGPAWALAFGFSAGAAVIIELLRRHRWPEAQG